MSLDRLQMENNIKVSSRWNQHEKAASSKTISTEATIFFRIMCTISVVFHFIFIFCYHLILN